MWASPLWLARQARLFICALSPPPLKKRLALPIGPVGKNFRFGVFVHSRTSGSFSDLQAPKRSLFCLAVSDYKPGRRPLTALRDNGRESAGIWG
jgi:hypothetical protein